MMWKQEKHMAYLLSLIKFAEQTVLLEIFAKTKKKHQKLLDEFNLKKVASPSEYIWKFLMLLRYF